MKRYLNKKVAMAVIALLVALEIITESQGSGISQVVVAIWGG